MAEIRVKTEQIEALQATAAALMAQCQAILPDPPAEDVKPTPATPAPSVPQSGPCLHPNREKAPRMGFEHAWYCPDCHEQGDK